MTIDITIKPDAASIGIATNIQTFNSTLNAFQQFRELPGSRWFASFTWSSRQGVDAKTLKGQFTSLNGPLGTFKISPPDSESLGTFLGAGLVNGAGQTGTTLITDGWGINQPSLGVVGDYFEINGELKILTESATSDGSGNATLTFAPAIRKSPADGSDVITSNPMLTARIVGDAPVWALSAPVIHAFSIDCSEVV
tara:strand:+ start:1928 stop:2515 length:588 start_codon:yes stop_codon:yes gene_type:complete